MKVIGIVAADRNWGIGKRGGLLYNLPLDMKHFRETTSYHVVVCGYNTLLSFPGGKPLSNRVTICVAPSEIERDDCYIVHTIEECLELMREISVSDGMEFYIIGGGMLYKSFLPYYDKVIVTKVEAKDSTATVFFPNLDKIKNFRIADRTEQIVDGEHKTSYVTYERVN